MDDHNLPAVHAEVKKSAKAPNPARKWLVVSAVGFVICISSLGFHIAIGGSSSSDPLPSKVLMQVFGFTPYYFTKNMPPDRLKIKLDTPKFYGNALSFDLVDAKGQKITVTQKTLPDKYVTASKPGDDSINAPQGSGMVNAVQGGHITASLVTKDKTLISLESSDILNADVMKDIMNNLVAIDKTTGDPVQQ